MASFLEKYPGDVALDFGKQVYLAQRNRCGRVPVIIVTGCVFTVNRFTGRQEEAAAAVVCMKKEPGNR